MPLEYKEFDFEYVKILDYFYFYFLLFVKYKFIHFNWRLVTLQYCSGFAIH